MGNGWAYIDCSEFATGSGPTGSVQFHVEGTAISGSKHFMFHTAAYGAHPPNSLILSGNMSITGTLSASVINYENITVIDATGSTYFGNTNDDIHARTGSLRASTLSTPVLWTTASANGATPYVGIGTAAPSHTLTVAGTLSGSSTLQIVGAGSFGSSVSATGSISGSSTLQIVGDADFGDNLNVTGAISGSNSLEVVGEAIVGTTLTVSGNVGINTQPSNNILLHVSGTTYMGNDGALLQIDSASGSVPAANAPILYVSGGGNGYIGLGTTTPTSQLHIKEGTGAGGAVAASSYDNLVIEGSTSPVGMSILGPSTGWSALAFGDSNDSTNGLLAYSHLSKYLQIGTGETDAYVRFMAGNSVEALRLESGLRVSASAGFHANGAATFGSSVFTTGSISGSSTLQAVGVTTLGSTLNVSGNTGIGTDATDGILLHVSSSGDGALLRVDGGTQSGSASPSPAALLFVTGSGPGSAQNTAALSGGVGIGTNTPTQVLEVFPDKDVAAIIGRAFVGYNGFNSDAATFGHRDLQGSHYALYQSAAGMTILNTGVSQAMYFRINNSTKTTLDSSGQFGIGTTSVQSLLHVSGSPGALFQIDALSGSIPSANAPILFVTGGAVGRVGIGTQTPTAQLAVNGALHVTGSVLPGADNTHDLGSADKRWANVYTGDLHLANDRGNWTVVEEEDYLTIKNNKTGKRFKLLMEEIE